MQYAAAPNRRRFIPAATVQILALPALLTLTAACGPDDTADPIFTPGLITSTTLPPSDHDQVALLADGRTACVIDSYRTTPKNYHLSTAQQLIDAENRYWIATQRELREWSYLDVYENAEYVGSVRVRDRIRGFDVLGSTLVVLVDRPVGADDADGVPDRALDWYEIGGTPSG